LLLAVAWNYEKICPIDGTGVPRREEQTLARGSGRLTEDELVQVHCVHIWNSHGEIPSYY
jgi:hypothetical protein